MNRWLHFVLHGAAAAVYLVVGAFGLSGGASAQPWKDNDPASRAARARQASAQTLEVEFKRTDVEPAGGWSGPQMAALKGAKAFPERETTSTSTNRLVLDGKKIRYENNHPLWFGNGTLRPNRIIAVVDRNTAKSVFPNGIAGTGGPTGFIRSRERGVDVHDAVLAPIFLNFRANDRDLCGTLLADMEPTGVALPIDGQVCKEYSLEQDQVIVSGWLDPAKDYRVCRYRYQRAIKLQTTQLTDIQYRADKTWGWLPATWTMHFYKNGNLWRTTTIEVTKMEIGKQVSTDAFELEFPTDTYVHDEAVDKYYRVQPDGTLRLVSANGKDLGVTVFQSTATVAQYYTWIVVAIGLAAALGLGLLLARRRAVPPRA